MNRDASIVFAPAWLVPVVSRIRGGRRIAPLCNTPRHGEDCLRGRRADSDRHRKAQVCRSRVYAQGLSSSVREPEVNLVRSDAKLLKMLEEAYRSAESRENDRVDGQTVRT